MQSRLVPAHGVLWHRSTLNYMRYIEQLEGELAEKNLEIDKLKTDLAQMGKEAVQFAEELRERLIPCDEYGRSIQPEVDLEDQINTFLNKANGGSL